LTKCAGPMICLAVLLVLFVLVCFGISLFAVIWFIIGNVWVFSKHSTVQYTNSSLGTYCNQTLYQYAFWSIIVSYILTVVSGCCSGCSTVCTPLLACFSGKNNPSDNRGGMKEVSQNDIELETKDKEAARDLNSDSD
jgi:hypothetical protein